MMSGGPIEKFTQGWAVRIFGFGRAHYFKRDGVGLAKSLCGRSTVKVGALRGAGNWTKCKACIDKVSAPQAKASA